MSGRRPPGQDEGDRTFRDAVADAKPLGGRGKLIPPAAPSRRGASRDQAPAPVRFTVESRGERVEGRAPGIDRAHLRRLRSGGVEVDARVDLHGLRADAARRALRRALEDAIDARARCVLIVHGRGLHSEGDGVLKRALPGWLAEAPIGSRVMAFASAAARDGGAGATYVLLRRVR